VPASDPTADRAVPLTAATGAATLGTDAIAALAAAGDRDALETVRADLLNRIHQRSDDYQATLALTLVNKALAAVGWHDPYDWRRRRKP
jgi:hypothetical protein